MTVDRIALAELLEKGSEPDLLRAMIASACPRAGKPDPGGAERLMALEVEGLCGAGHGERSPERRHRPGGYRERPRGTRAGTVELRIPQLRQGSCFPAFLEPRRPAEKALSGVIQEAGARPRAGPRVQPLAGP